MRNLASPAIALSVTNHRLTSHRTTSTGEENDQLIDQLRAICDTDKSLRNGGKQSFRASKQRPALNHRATGSDPICTIDILQAWNSPLRDPIQGYHRSTCKRAAVASEEATVVFTFMLNLANFIDEETLSNRCRHPSILPNYISNRQLVPRPISIHLASSWFYHFPKASHQSRHCTACPVVRKTPKLNSHALARLPTKLAEAVHRAATCSRISKIRSAANKGAACRTTGMQAGRRDHSSVAPTMRCNARAATA